MCFYLETFGVDFRCLFPVGLCLRDDLCNCTIVKTDKQRYIERSNFSRNIALTAGLMKNWACLPYDLLVFTAGLLKKFEDFAAFGAVCKSWHVAAKKEYFKALWSQERTPYVLLPVKNGNDEIRELYSLAEGEIVASVRVPKFSKKKCFESLGWFLVVEEDGSMCLLDPFSRAEIPLPHQSTFPDHKSCRHPYKFIRKMVLSARPNECPNFIVAIIYRCSSDLAFWKPGETSWYKIKTSSGFYQDVTYHDGHFYSFGYKTLVRMYNFVEGNPPEGQVIAAVDLPINLPEELFGGINIYITKTFDSLLLIIRTFSAAEDGYYKMMTFKLQVYELNVSLSKWRKIDNLGNMAIFVGSQSATTVVDVSRYPGFIKANHIYFIDDGGGDPYGYDGHLRLASNGKDKGIYNLENGTIDPFYNGEEILSRISHPTWIMPFLWQK